MTRTSILATVSATGLLAATLAVALPASADPQTPADPIAAAQVRARAAVAALDGALTTAATRGGASAPVVVVQGLNNPRQLDLTGEGVLIIAESGRGGPDCVGEGEEAVCVGTTAAVAGVLKPALVNGVSPLRLVTGLLSESGPDGSFATGNDGASARSLDRIHMVKDVDLSVPGNPNEQQGKLLRAVAQMAPTVVADIRAYEVANDPDGQGVETNPYAALDLGGTVLVGDAAGNDILAVDAAGAIRVFAVLANITDGICGVPSDRNGDGVIDAGDQNNGEWSCDAVPTSMTFSSDGDILVSLLGSLVDGAGRVVELDRATGAVEKTWTGFTGVTGAAQDKDGNLYVSELFGGANALPGQVVLAPKIGARKALGVPFPAGVVADKSGRVYVSAFSTSTSDGLGFPGSDGQVWRISKRTFG